MPREAPRDPRRTAIAVVAFVSVLAPLGARAQDIDVEPGGGGICDIDPSACPKQGDIEALGRRGRGPRVGVAWVSPGSKQVYYLIFYEIITLFKSKVLYYLARRRRVLPRFA